LHLKALAIIEAIEHEYIRQLNRAQAEDAVEFAKSTLNTYDILLEKASRPDDRSLLLHHKAKALKRFGDKPAAEELYRAILASACPLHQSRLQLARLLERRGEGDEAAKLMKVILQSAKDSMDSVSITVILEVFGTLRHRHLLRFRDDFAHEFSDIALSGNRKHNRHRI
jgi:thioredoxin-like negative regulator of GroEL